ncbi:hypothetical protein KUCAC02_035173 [Chaenocephalus aceratus]|nr:hypothetical protein KUCAC02_035173 [Chaenocephalus aceratus]
MASWNQRHGSRMREEKNVHVGAAGVKEGEPTVEIRLHSLSVQELPTLSGVFLANGRLCARSLPCENQTVQGTTRACTHLYGSLGPGNLSLRNSGVWLLPVLEALKVSPLIEKVSDHKDFKKLLRTRTNVLVAYTKTARSLDKGFQYRAGSD